MTKSKLLTLILMSLVLISGATDAFAWQKGFKGTRDQVRAACSGPGMVLTDGDTGTACKNNNNGNEVNCNDNGECGGSGPGPMPRTINPATTGVVGTVLGLARTGVDLTQFGFDANSNSSGKQAPQIEKKGVGGTGHIGNGNM